MMQPPDVTIAARDGCRVLVRVGRMTVARDWELVKAGDLYSVDGEHWFKRLPKTGNIGDATRAQ